MFIEINRLKTRNVEVFCDSAADIGMSLSLTV